MEVFEPEIVSDPVIEASPKYWPSHYPVIPVIPEPSPINEPENEPEKLPLLVPEEEANDSRVIFLVSLVETSTTAIKSVDEVISLGVAKGKSVIFFLKLAIHVLYIINTKKTYDCNLFFPLKVIL